MSLIAFPRPFGVEDPAVLVLYQFCEEIQTGLVIATVTLSNEPIAGTLQLFKNGLLLTLGAGAARYTRSRRTITLGTAAIAGDEFAAYYHYRNTRDA